MVSVDKVRCVGCGFCIRVCPTGAITIINDRANINHLLCLGCLLCASACGKGAINLTLPNKILEIKLRLSRLSNAITNLHASLEQLSRKI